MPASVYAAVAAATVSLIELEVARRARPTLKAVGLLLVLLAFDGAAGLFGYWVLGITFGSLDWWNVGWQILTAGLVGPAILRAQLALLGSGQEDAVYGPGNRFGRIRKDLVDDIENLSSAAQSRWASRRTDQVMAVGLQDFVFQVTAYVNARTSLAREVRLNIISYMDTQMKDAASSDRDKCQAIILKLLECDCRAVISSATSRRRWL